MCLLAPVVALGLASGLGSVGSFSDGAAQALVLVPPTDRGRFVADSSAEDGQALLLYRESTAEGRKDVTAPTATVVVPVPAPDGDLLFDADVARNGLSSYAHVIHGERISVVDDPVLGDARQVMRFTVQDGDVGPTPNPRAQVETPKVVREGDEVWVGWSTLFPSSWPDRLPPGGASWITLSELYGPPYSGAAPVKLGMRSGVDALTWQRNGTYDWDVPWEEGPVVKNRWYDQVLHVRLSDDPEVGFVELYINTGAGWEQQTLGGTSRLHMRTLDSANGGGPNYHKLALYRKRGMYPVLTVFHGEHRVGTSFDAVAPNSYPDTPGP